jgi:hypothetical protein
LLPGDVDAIRSAAGTNGSELELDRKIRLMAHGILLERLMPLASCCFLLRLERSLAALTQFARVKDRSICPSASARARSCSSSPRGVDEILRQTGRWPRRASSITPPCPGS